MTNPLRQESEHQNPNWASEYDEKTLMLRPNDFHGNHTFWKGLLVERISHIWDDLYFVSELEKRAELRFVNRVSSHSMPPAHTPGQ